MCLLIAMRGPHAAADNNIIPHKRSALDNGDIREIMREHIHVILWRHSNRNLEFARQIGRAINRLGLRLRRHLFIIDKDFPPRI